MFREELEDIKNLHMGRLNIIHILESDAQEIDLFTGLVTAEKCNELFKHWIDVSRIDTAFICGPQPMMLGIAEALRAHGMSDSQVKFELFKSDQPGRANRGLTWRTASIQLEPKPQSSSTAQARLLS